MAAATQTLPAEIKRERERLLAEQGPSAIVRSGYLDRPNYYKVIGKPYSSRRLSFSQMYEMQTDAILAFAALVSLIPLFQAKWRIECANPRKAEFLDKSLRRIYGRLISQFSQSWFFGFQGLVKTFGLTIPGWQYINPKTGEVEDVWPSKKVPALVWEPFVTLPPETIEPVYLESNGQFDGIKFDGTGAYSFPSIPMMVSKDGTQKEIARKIELRNSLWITNQRDTNVARGVWGWPRTGYAFKYWWAGEMTLGILNRSTERKGDPVVVVRHPPGVSKYNGQEVDNQLIARDIGNKARSGAVLTIPSEIYDETEGKGAPKWAIEYLKVEEQFGELREILGYLDVAKFRSMAVSELSVAEGSGGTSSRNVAAETGIRTAQTQNGTQQEWDDYINRYMLPQLADQNFPELADVPARKITKTFGDDETELAKRIFESFANANSDKLPLDWGAMAEDFGMPTLSIEAVAEAQKELETKSPDQPPPTDAPAGSNSAGVTDTGFYYAAPELIQLSEDETLLAQLPDTKHFSDKAILAQARLIRKLWADLFKAQYEHFAAHLESVELSELDLADDPETKKARAAAKKIVGGWRYTAKATAATVKRTAQALSDIFARAGRIELQRGGLSFDDWKPEEKELADWVTNNAAAMVRLVDEATREQLRVFLVDQVKRDRNAKEIAEAAREHFAEHYGWRADRLARTEVRKFYNAATAFAAQAVKAQVQMLDARHGPTDKDCVRRNGQIVSPEEFLIEDAKEHPNGTLAGRILKNKVKLSIRYVNADDLEDNAVQTDRDRGIIYLRDDLLEEQVGQYLDMVGRWLEANPSYD